MNAPPGKAAGPRVAIGGSSGLIGKALRASFERNGIGVARLVRSGAAPAEGDILWDPERDWIETENLEGVGAVVHLGGENIAEGRWTRAKKRRMHDSRIKSTKLLADALGHLKRPPGVFVAASAIGYYGERDMIVDESSPPGTGFLADLCRDWEIASESAADAGIRVVNLRIGVVLTPEGGALKKMLLPFKLGLGGPVGSGEQVMSWISLHDLVDAIRFCVADPLFSGPVNAVSPGAVTNKEFAETLGRVLGRPAKLPLPAFMVKLLFGEMGVELLLKGQRVHPERLIEGRFPFRHAELEPALRELLGRG